MNYKYSLFIYEYSILIMYIQKCLLSTVTYWSPQNGGEFFIEKIAVRTCTIVDDSKIIPIVSVHGEWLVQESLGQADIESTNGHLIIFLVLSCETGA